MIRNLRSELYRGRDVVVCFGQSNMGTYGDAIEVWPQRERNDPNYPIAIYSGGWQPASEYHPSVGLLPLSIAAQMRYRGLRPAIIAHWLGGNSSAQLLAALDYYAPYCVARIAELAAPRSVTLAWSQGESDASGATWTTNTEDSFAAMRSALGLPNMRICVVLIAETYTPPPAPEALPYLAEIRAAQIALAAADSNAVAIDVPNVATVNAGIHLGQPDLDRQAQLIAADILDRI